MDKVDLIYQHNDAAASAWLTQLCVHRQAAKLFIGQHDFTHFANVGNPDPSPVKTIRRFEVLPSDTGFVFQVEGSGFMYKMVRHSPVALESS